MVVGEVEMLRSEIVDVSDLPPIGVQRHRRQSEGFARQ